MAPLGVVLATFGSAVTSDDVPAYLASVRGGREVPAELIDEFRRRYDRIGRSPLIDITLAQCAALQALLDRAGDGEATRVVAGMLHSDPQLGDALDTLAAGGSRRVVVVVLSPQYSPIILAGYERTVAVVACRAPGRRRTRRRRLASHPGMDRRARGAGGGGARSPGAARPRSDSDHLHGPQPAPPRRRSRPRVHHPASRHRRCDRRTIGPRRRALELCVSERRAHARRVAHPGRQGPLRGVSRRRHHRDPRRAPAIPRGPPGDPLRHRYRGRRGGDGQRASPCIASRCPNTQPAFIRALAAVVAREREGAASTAVS